MGYVYIHTRDSDVDILSYILRVMRLIEYRRRPIGVEQSAQTSQSASYSNDRGDVDMHVVANNTIT